MLSGRMPSRFPSSFHTFCTDTLVSSGVYALTRSVLLFAVSLGTRLVAVQAFLTFLPEILDFCTVFIFWKIIYGLLPAAIRTGCQRVSVNRAYEAIDALFQNNGDALRTLAILVVVIPPSLLNCSAWSFPGCASFVSVVIYALSLFIVEPFFSI